MIDDQGKWKEWCVVKAQDNYVRQYSYSTFHWVSENTLPMLGLIHLNYFTEIDKTIVDNRHNVQ